MRFSDGLGTVSIPEFLEFFTTPVQMRQAKAATSAVHMSLDLLQLRNQSSDQDDDAGEEGENDETEEGEEPENTPVRRTITCETSSS